MATSGSSTGARRAACAGPPSPTRRGSGRPRSRRRAPSVELDRATAERLSDAKGDIDRHLSHLTWARVDDGAVEWPYKNLARQVVEAFRSLVEDAEADIEQGGGRATPMVAAVLRTALEKVDELAPPVASGVIATGDSWPVLHSTLTEPGVTLTGAFDPLATALDVTKTESVSSLSPQSIEKW